MCLRFFTTLLIGSAFFSHISRAEVPPLLTQALQQWAAGGEDLAFTQHTRVWLDDGSKKEERTERYDPSLPDQQRWHLLEVNGRKPTDEERAKWETKKNSRPRKKAIKSPAEYLDLEHATLVQQSPQFAGYTVSFRAEAARLIDVEKVAVLISIEKQSGAISHISATLHEPLRVALGLVKITDIDLDVGIETPDGDARTIDGDVQQGGTARIMMTRFGNPTEFRWSDFKRVRSYHRSSDANSSSAQ